MRGHTYFLTKGKWVSVHLKGGVSEDWEIGRVPSYKVYVISVIRKVNLQYFGCVLLHT